MINSGTMTQKYSNCKNGSEFWLAKNDLSEEAWSLYTDLFFSGTMTKKYSNCKTEMNSDWLRMTLAREHEVCTQISVSGHFYYVLGYLGETPNSDMDYKVFNVRMWSFRMHVQTGDLGL